MRQAGSHVGSHVGIDKIAATFKQWGRLIKADYIAKNKENAAKVLGEPVQVLLKELQSQSSELHKLRTTFSNLNLEKLYSAVGEVYRDMGWQQVQLGILLQHLEGWTDTAETVALPYGNTEFDEPTNFESHQYCDESWASCRFPSAALSSNAQLPSATFSALQQLRQPHRCWTTIFCFYNCDRPNTRSCKRLSGSESSARHRRLFKFRY
jgi:hypothetical protein